MSRTEAWWCFLSSHVESYWARGQGVTPGTAGTWSLSAGMSGWYSLGKQAYRWACGKGITVAGTWSPLSIGMSSWYSSGKQRYRTLWTIWQDPVEMSMPVSCDQSIPFLVCIIENNSKLCSRGKTCQQMSVALLLPCEMERALICARTDSIRWSVSPDMYQEPSVSHVALYVLTEKKLKCVERDKGMWHTWNPNYYTEYLWAQKHWEAGRQGCSLLSLCCE